MVNGANYFNRVNIKTQISNRIKLGLGVNSNHNLEQMEFSSEHLRIV